MSVSAADIAAILLLVLPGFLAYRFAVYRRVDPAERSPLWQLTEILEYSVYVHLVGIGLVFALHGILQSLGAETHLRDLPGRSPVDFLNDHFLTGSLLFTLYPVYVILASMIMGAYDLPTSVGNLVVRLTQGASSRVSSLPHLGWVRPPAPEYPREPVWYLAFNAIPRQTDAKRILLIVKMKLGDIYFGELASYPLQSDELKDKDFLLRNSRYYPGGDLDQEYRLDDADGGGTVLLNTADVDSIQVFYQQ